MTFEMGWLEPGRVVFVKFRGEMTVEEIHEESQQLIEYLDNGASPLVHSLVDLTTLDNFPINVGVLNRATVDSLRHPRLGWTVLITDNRMVKYLGAMVTGLSGVRYRTFTSLNEALTFLNEVDSTLPDLLAYDQD